MMVPYDGCYIVKEVSGSKVLLFLVIVYLCHAVLFNYLCYISEWQLRAAHAVVGEPTEVVLPRDDIHGYSHVLLVGSLCLLL